ncbi:prenyltransferase/squalene oxidase repeat-containing protein [Amycolatopsis magusensis]|uniref:prenyltransferase/squalene oxidase repeat-containing protein n=1 Tax=Amycolatopsis magusensis TaxID=882444 RepID=UPI003792842C
MRAPVRALAGITAAGALVAAIALPSPAAEADPHAAAGATAAKWLAGELTGGTLPGFMGTDWGLTIDALFALSATGRPEVTAVADAIDTGGAGYYTFPIDANTTAWIGGATAKTLTAAVSAGRDPKNFTGRDIRQATLELIAPDGDVKGQLRSKNTGNDGSNTFDQALAVLGLARSGGVPADAVGFLVKQQCPAGGFRLGGSFAEGSMTCTDDSTIDPDSTGMAVQALLEADKNGIPGAKAAADKGAAYLARTQRADGSFGGSGPTVGSNTNSTGLAGQALAVSGNTAAANRAADWVLAHQLSTQNAGKATGELGAIAYNKESFDDAVANAVDGRIPDMQRDQWRRTAAQALLTLAKLPLTHKPVEPGPGPDPVDPPSETSVPSSSSSAPPASSSSSQPSSTQPGTSTSAGFAAAPKNTTGSSQQKKLAQTGAPVAEFAVGGVVLVAAGAGLLFAGRRRNLR